MIWLWAQKICAFGCLGLLVEVLFTGLHELINGNKSATGKTYLWMFFVWGLGGPVLEQAKEWMFATAWWQVFPRAIIFLILIYAMEFSWGWFFEKTLGRCPWRYTDPISQEKIHKFSVMGFIRLDYALFWYVLAIGFDLFGNRFQAAVNVISRL